jgi:hypothetical protein
LYAAQPFNPFGFDKLYNISSVNYLIQFSIISYSPYIFSNLYWAEYLW